MTKVGVEPTATGVRGGAFVATKAKSVFSGKHAAARMKTWELPGDKENLHKLRVVTNSAPLIFLPAFLLLIYTDGQGWIQETTTIWTNGTTYIGPEEGLDTLAGAAHTATKENDSRKRRDLLYFPKQVRAPTANLQGASLQGNLTNSSIGNSTSNPSGQTLTCLYGNPEAIWGEKFGYFCPLMFNHKGPVITPFVWFIAFVVILGIVCCKGSKEVKKEKRAIRNGKEPDFWREGNTRFCITYPVGLYLGFYENGLKPAHIHLWLVGIASLFIHSFLGRVFTDQNGKCMRFGDWDGHWDKCLPLSVVDTGPLFSTAALVYGCWIGGLWTVPKPGDGKNAVWSPPEEMDAVTQAAVSMKSLVHRQMRDNKRKNAKSPMTLGKAFKSVMAMVAATDEVEEAMGEVMEGASDMVAEVQAAVEAAGGDFVEGFADQLNEIANMAEGELDGLGFTEKAQDHITEQIEKGQDLANQKVQNFVGEATNLHTMGREASRFKAPPSPYFSVSAGAMIGCLAGFAMAGVFLMAPRGPISPFRQTTGYPGHPKFCLEWTGKGEWTRGEGSEAWCNGQAVGTQNLGDSIFYRTSFDNMLVNFTPQIIILCVLKVFSAIVFGVLFFIMLQTTLEPFQEASVPMVVMSSIMNSWVLEKRCTVNQLNAWVLARKSLLFNECRLMVLGNEKVVFFYILIMMGLLAVQVLQTFKTDRIAASTMTAVALTGFSAIICVQAATACHTEQQKHVGLLNNLKEALVCAPAENIKQIDVILKDPEGKGYQTRLALTVPGGRPAPSEVVKQIDVVLANFEKQDYQTKLMVMPLNPAVLKGIIGYLVTGCGMLIGKVAGVA